MAEPTPVNTQAQRFWVKVEKTDSCWNWTAGRTYDGYGQFWDGRTALGAHLFSYRLSIGPVPLTRCVTLESAGHSAAHDTPKNPETAVTHGDSMLT